MSGKTYQQKEYRVYYKFPDERVERRNDIRSFNERDARISASVQIRLAFPGDEFEITRIEEVTP